MLNKFATVSLSVLMAASVFAGCAKKEAAPQGATSPAPAKSEAPAAAKGYVPKELKVQFVPSQNAETLEAKAKPLEKLLKDKLGIDVKVTVSTSYNTVIEAMASKQVDVGFLPPNTYVLAHDQKKIDGKPAVDVLLQAQRFAIEEGTGKELEGKLADSYRSMFVVKKDSPIKELKDLKGKKIAWQGVTSSAGYVWPAAEMKKAGLDPEKDVTGIEVKGHDKGILAVLNGEVDAAAVFEDARNTVKKDIPDIFDKTRVIHYTQGIPNDTIAVRSDMDQEWKKKVQDAFIAIGQNPDGKKIIYEVYSHQGYVASDDKKFDIVRDYAKQVGQK